MNQYAGCMVFEIELKAPTFLIAVPQLGDPHFFRGVVLVLEHGEEGSMGLILNKPSSLAYSTFFKSQSMRYKGDQKALVYQGGPVQTDRAFLLHDSDHDGPETEHVLDRVRLSYSLESLRMLADDPPKHLRIFLGYAGWGPGQLAKEVTAGAWLLSTAEPDLVFNTPPSKVWEAALRDMGIDPVQLVHSGAVH